MASKEKVIVVIGDWFIDENWLVSKQNLIDSSYTGDEHYQLRQKKVNQKFISLCGTAAILEILRNYFEDNVQPRGEIPDGQWIENMISF